jgi:DNA primase
MPLAWDELTVDVRPRNFGFDAALGRIERLGDLWEPVLHGRQALGPAQRALDRLPA